jgi:hypothetical protein
MLWLLCHALLFVKKLNNFKPLKLERKIFFVFVGGINLAFDKRVIIYDSIFVEVNDLHQKVSIVAYGAHHHYYKSGVQFTSLKHHGTLKVK